MRAQASEKGNWRLEGAAVIKGLALKAVGAAKRRRRARTSLSSEGPSTR
jgi:hypothetical protein